MPTVPRHNKDQVVDQQPCCVRGKDRVSSLVLSSSLSSPLSCQPYLRLSSHAHIDRGFNEERYAAHELRQGEEHCG